jgi:basic amino acid/polyamine antiporter, APA family
MAVQDQLPAQLTRVHRRFRTPHVSILVSAAAVLMLALSGTFIYALNVTVITRVIVYASTCVALPILRRRSRIATPVGDASSSFQLPQGNLISVVCVILCLCLLANSGWREARDVAIAIVIGLAIYAVTRFGHERSNA